MGKCTYLSDRKVVIRLLPPNMTVDDCNQMLSTNGFHVGIEYSLLYYVQGSLLSLPFSRCYIEMNSIPLVNGIIKCLDRMSLPGSSNKISVSSAPFSFLPIKKSYDIECSLEDDEHYKAFLENEKKDYEETTTTEEEKKFKPLELSDDEEEGNKLAEASRKAFLQQVHRELMDEKRGKLKKMKSKSKPKKEKKPKKKKAGNVSRASNQPTEKVIQPPIPEEPKPTPTVIEKPTIVNETKPTIDSTPKPTPVLIRPKLINPATATETPSSAPQRKPALINPATATETPSSAPQRKPVLINPTKPAVIIKPPVDRVLQQPGKTITISSNKQNKKPMENESQPPVRQNVMPRPIIIKKTQ